MRGISENMNVVKARLLIILFVICGLLVPAARTHAATATTATPTEGFAIQISPSPLIGTLKPGQTSSFELQIRNTNSTPQALKMGLRSFSVNETSGQVQLGNDAPGDVSKFVSFANPKFTIESGQIFTQRVVVDTPASAGFTYSFAITVSQQNPPKAAKGTSAIQGSVAVFTLLSVDRPGAVRKLELGKFGARKNAFEYLPASFDLQLKNTGNTLVQPTGTIYIQRGENDEEPLATIQLNKAGGYILPGSSRLLTTEWNDGFPHYETSTVEGKTTKKLTWDGGNIGKLRMGRYTAKLVAVYDDGERDVPLNAEVTFWVIPWRMLLLLLVIVVVVIIGIITILRNSTKAIKNRPKRNAASK